jgi:hypothetical protein
MKKNIRFLLIAILFLQACTPKTYEIPATEPPPGVSNETPEVISPAALQPTQENTIQLTDGSLTLTIFSPVDGSSVTSSPVEVHGTTNTETVMTINGWLYLLTADQEFSCLVDLVDGYNSIEVVASDYEGNQVEKILTVIYEE